MPKPSEPLPTRLMRNALDAIWECERQRCRTMILRERSMAIRQHAGVSVSWFAFEADLRACAMRRAALMEKPEE